MGRSPRISEGKCAAYGRDPPNASALMANERARMHNEKMGMPRTDMSGANTSLSLVWNPRSTASAENKYDLKSHTRVSNLRLVQDFGANNILRNSIRTASPRAPTPPPALTAIMREPPPHLSGPIGPRAFLDTETSRLQASAHARKLGQTFLLAGNLTMAKAYLARAEQILQVQERFYVGQKADDLLDEMKQMRKDPFN